LRYFLVFQALSRAKQVLPRPPKGFKAPTRDHPSPIPASIRDFSIVFLIESSPWFLPIPLFSLIPLVFIWAYKGIQGLTRAYKGIQGFRMCFMCLLVSCLLQRYLKSPLPAPLVSELPLLPPPPLLVPMLSLPPPPLLVPMLPLLLLLGVWVGVLVAAFFSFLHFTKKPN